MTTDLNARAAELWPDRWAQMETLTGKRRANARRALRENAETHDKMAALPATARCGTCEHRARREGVMICDLESDFRGYMKVSDEHVCAHWTHERSEA